MNYDNGAMDVGGLRVGYRVEGSGDPVVLLHGLNSHSGTWRKLFPGLSERFLVFAPSLPARSGETLEAVVGRCAKMVSSMCKKLGIGRAFFIGNSIGGWVAMRLAGDEGLVERLVLEGSAGCESDDAVRLAARHIPTLIIWGAEDDVSPLNYGRILNARLPDSRLEVLEGAGHVPHWEQPERFFALVERFSGSR